MKCITISFAAFFKKTVELLFLLFGKVCNYVIVLRWSFKRSSFYKSSLIFRSLKVFVFMTKVENILCIYKISPLIASVLYDTKRSGHTACLRRFVCPILCACKRRQQINNRYVWKQTLSALVIGVNYYLMIYVSIIAYSHLTTSNLCKIVI